MTTLVWPSEAISKTVLDTLISPGGPFELQEEDVLGVGRPPAKIQSLSQTEVLRQANGLHVGEIVPNLRAAVPGPVIDEDHLQAGACIGRLDGCQALPQHRRPVPRHHYYRHTWRLLLLF